MTYYIGQALGVVAILLAFLNYQVRSQRAVIAVNLITSLVFCVHYGMIGAITGMALNIIGVFRNTAYFIRNEKGSHDKITPIVCTAAMFIAGVVTWQSWPSLFMLLALTINTYAMSFTNPQNVRKSILITSPMALFYNIMVSSYGGSVYESVAIISAAIGIIRFYKKQKQ